MKTAQEIRAGLKRLSPTTYTHQHKSGFKYTSKVKYLSEAADCWAIIDTIGKHQPKCRRYMIQNWRVDLREDKIRLSFSDYSENRIFWLSLPANDFPLWEGIELRVCSDILYIPRRQQLQRPRLVLCREVERAA